MSQAIQSIRGMHDILPGSTPAWRYLEACCASLLDAYGYRQIRLPIVEKTALFARSIGEVTDIVEKEMYTFEDRSGDSLSLRPEGTAGCVRAGIQHGLLHNQQQRLWYSGPMFRHERPQKGRYRQFHQIGVEAYGFAEPDIDVEIILLGARLWRRLGLGDVRLEINSLGSQAVRAQYRDALVAYLEQHRELLDEDANRRLYTNPLRILDSKNPALAGCLAAAPRLLDHLDEASKAHFDQVKQLLDAAGIDYTVNPRLVRGLDYYSHTVFEWVSDALGAQGTVCAGGRYDGLVSQLGGRETPAIGFAMGLERLLALLEAQNLLPPPPAPQVFIVTPGAAAREQGLVLAEQLRDALPGCQVLLNAGGGSLKSQLKRADRAGAEVAVILGEQELAAGQASLKWLQQASAQTTVALAQLPSILAQQLTATTTHSNLIPESEQ